MSTLSIPASLPSTATIIFLHGLGQTNTSWMPWVKRLAQHLPTVNWILPQAETGPLTFSDSEHCPRWFDVHVLPPGEDEDDKPGAAASMDHIQQIIQDLIDNGLASKKIFLAGFSQGSAMALLSGLTSKNPLGGIAVLSGWLPPKLRELVPIAPPAACPPLFWSHGTADIQIPLQNALDVMQWLRSSLAAEQTGFVYHEYPGLEHRVSDEVLRDLHLWFVNLLP